MVSHSIAGASATSDATLRVHVDDPLVLDIGDGATPAGAYAAAEAAVLETAAQTGVDAENLRRLLDDALGIGHVCVRVDAVHADGLMGRIAALVTPFPVTAFSYHRSMDGVHARAGLCLEGTEWHVERVAHKIRRAVGVLEVHTDPLGH